MRANRHFQIAVMVATVLFFVWSQAAVAETPVQEHVGDLARVYPELVELQELLEGYAPVPQTGQKSCYACCDAEEQWYELDVCPGTTGQDGEIQMGVEWSADTRFTDNRNGTVKDNLTGLVWLQDLSCFERMTWSEALNASNALAAPACGLSDGSEAGDWRLPNIRELHSLVDFGKVRSEEDNNVLPAGHPFSNVQTTYYWSSTTIAYSADWTWGVRMHYGAVYYYSKATTGYVWPVRSDQ